MIELRTLGTSEIQTESSTLTPSQEVVFAAALYLILERDTPVRRAALASLLWADAPPRTRGHRLRQTLFQLKRLGVKVLATRDAVRISLPDTHVDFEGLADLPLSEWPKTVEFLPGYDPSISRAFQDWIDRTRDYVHVLLTRCLLTQLAAARTSGNWRELDRISSVCLRLDPYNESALLARAESFAMRGQKAAAISVLDTYIQEVSPINHALALPAAMLRKRVAQHVAPIPSNQFISREHDCLGREGEMAILTQCLAHAREGRGRGCLINGEAGIGKTRLSSELAKFAELQGVRVERVGCKRSDIDQPLSAFVSLVPKLQDLPGSLGVSQQSLLWLKRLVQVDTSTTEAGVVAEDSGQLYTMLRSAVFDLLDAVSEERCLVLLVDDIQWLDRASANLFGSILESVESKQVLLIFTSRQSNTLMEGFVSPDRLTVISLSPLGEEAAFAIIGEVVAESGDHSTEGDFDWLIRTADGNPYFLQELTKHWIETGRQHELPPSVATVLEERIARLSGVARHALQACAVLGDNSNLERIEQVLEYPSYLFLTAIQELNTAGMLRSSAPSETQPSLQLRHDLLAVEVLKTLSPGSLAFLHRRCGVALEQEVLGTSVSTSLLRACSFHWHNAGDSARAFELALKCASHLLEIGLALDSALALEGALAFCRTAEQQVDVLKRIVLAQRMDRGSAAVLETIARIRNLQGGATASAHHDDLELIEFEARRTIDSEIGPLFSRTLRCIYDTCLHHSHRLSAAAVALKLASSLPDLGELKRIYLEVAPLLVESDVDKRTRLQVLTIYNTMCGDLLQGVRFAKERVAFERVEGTPLQLANAITDLAFVMRRTAPEDAVLNVLYEAYEIGTRGKLLAATRDYAERIAASLVDSRHPDAAEWIARARESSGENPQFNVLFSASVTSARLALNENRIDDAERIVNEFRWDWLRYRRGWLAAALGLRIAVRVARTGEPDDLKADVEKLRELYGITAALGGQDCEVASLCNGLVALGENQAARTCLNDYLSSKRRDIRPYAHELVTVCEVLHSGDDGII